ncbi:MAG TPA: glycosyltransferase [Cyclobacteriaceae bacterium]
MTAFFSLVLISYLVILAAAIRGWYSVRSSHLESDEQKRMMTVVIAFRNEEKVIHHLIHSLKNLNYPKDILEVILVDDHSEDNSFNVVESLIYDSPNFKVVSLSEGRAGKKAAISQAVEVAKGEIIVTTDADCQVQVNWLDRINDAFKNDTTNLVFGGVKLTANKSFFSSLQAIEFTSLIGSMAAAIGLGSFIMGNGANLSFRKAAFQYVKGYEGNAKIASGDDEFLARKIMKAFPSSLYFNNEAEAVVSSRPIISLKHFISQRIRWASKWKYNAFSTSGATALYVILVQLASVSVVISLFRVREGMLLLLSILVVKLLLECWFLFKVSAFLQSRWHWVAFLVLQFIYPFYVLGIGIVSQVGLYTWKGRRISN